MRYSDKEVIVFDLDGTLAESKGVLSSEMSDLLEKLLGKKKVAVISGGAYKQFEVQFLSKLECSDESLANLYLFPTDATSMYKYEGGKWQNVYEEVLSEEERSTITSALKESLAEAGYVEPEQTFGEIIEDRKTQITFSGLGQEAPFELKKDWDPEHNLRNKIIEVFEKRLTEYDAKIGGSTSIDINRKGIDKAYGIEQIKKHLNVDTDQILFVGDALFEGGNDHAVIRTGVDTISVDGPSETMEIIREILK